MKKSILVAAAVLAGSITFAQKKMKQAPPPPPPPPIENLKEVPPPPPPPPKAELPKDYKDFLQRNSTVKGLSWSQENKVRIHLKSGKEEVFDMNNKEDADKLKNQYGELPAAPPPPPPPPPAPKKPRHITES